jgi:hypothetical protein
MPRPPSRHAPPLARGPGPRPQPQRACATRVPSAAPPESVCVPAPCVWRDAIPPRQAMCPLARRARAPAPPANRTALPPPAHRAAGPPRCAAPARRPTPIGAAPLPSRPLTRRARTRARVLKTRAPPSPNPRARPCHGGRRPRACSDSTARRQAPRRCARAAPAPRAASPPHCRPSPAPPGTPPARIRYMPVPPALCKAHRAAIPGPGWMGRGGRRADGESPLQWAAATAAARAAQPNPRRSAAFAAPRPSIARERASRSARAGRGPLPARIWGTRPGCTSSRPASSPRSRALRTPIRWRCQT